MARHKEAFGLWRETAALFEREIKAPRTLGSPVHTVLDMLMLQEINAHGGLVLLAQHGLMEDAATLARRLMELSVQGLYIEGESDEKTRTRRAGSYLAFLWRKLPRRAKHILPESLREEWSAVARSYGRFVPRKQPRWGPRWSTMFRECGIDDLYRIDYAFLSGIAHGSPEAQIFRFSMDPIRLRDDRYVAHLVVYGSKYFSVLGYHWNRCFQLIPENELEELRKKLVAWKPRN